MKGRISQVAEKDKIAAVYISPEVGIPKGQCFFLSRNASFLRKDVSIIRSCYLIYTMIKISCAELFLCSPVERAYVGAVAAPCAGHPAKRSKRPGLRRACRRHSRRPKNSAMLFVQGSGQRPAAVAVGGDARPTPASHQAAPQAPVSTC